MPLLARSAFRLALLVSLSVMPAHLMAQPAAAPSVQVGTPSLTARLAGIDSEATRGRKLALDRLDVRVRVHGTIAETEITARFANDGRDILEGDFRLVMPQGSVVTGYALDIGDRMVDGVLVDQRQGRIAYEARVRQRIDPGLAEVDRAGLFRTRVFPIAPRSSRTIRLRFTTPLDPRTGYVLPIEDSGQIGSMTLNIEASGVGEAPRVQLPSGLGERWTSQNSVHRLSIERRNLRLDGDLVISGAPAERTLRVSRHSNGTRFFELYDTAQPGRGEVEGGGKVAILWDSSLSRADDDLEPEIALARRYVERVRPGAIELVLFGSGGVMRLPVRDAAELVSRLRSVRYRGATSLAALGRDALDGVQSCLLFSDGLVTIDRRDSFQPQCPLFVLSSAPDADRAWLRALARRSGGEAFDLAARPADEILTRMTRPVPRVAQVLSTAGAPVDYTLLDGGENGWRIVGPMPASDDVIVRLSGVSGERERLYSAPRGPDVESSGPAALWAAERAALMAASDDRDRDALIAFSSSWSVASPDVSFIVLETGRDYAMARFDPPANLPPALLDEYRRTREEMKERETAESSTRLRTVLAEWDEMRTWWRTPFDPSRGPRRGRDTSGVEGQPVPRALPSPVLAAPMAPPPQQRSGDESVVVTGTRIRGSGAANTAEVEAVQGDASTTASPDRRRPATIALEPWAPNRPYLAALDAAAPADRDRVFAEQQRIHGALPAFWLDVADLAFRQGRRAEAIELVLSALELPTRNNQTLSIVADRLMRYGEIDRAIFLYERLLAAEDDRPQPRRTLALALAKRAEGAPREQARADLARALSLLTEVVMSPLDNAYQGIDLIALMEANRLIPLYRQLGGRDLALDPRLIDLLDVDLRVVIEWNSEATDVDLWVDEPTGERAIYNNPRTATGGRLSNDMTQGFGPEEYLLRRAPDGTYEVRANVFAADRLNPNGGQRVTARIIRDWGRPTEREEVVDLELLPTDQTRERRIGTVVFGRQQQGQQQPKR